MQKSLERCAELTSQIYQLVPMSDNDYWAIAPIQHANTVKQL